MTAIPRKLAEELGLVKPRNERNTAPPIILRGLPIESMRLWLPYPPPLSRYHVVFNNRILPSKDAKHYWKAVSLACTEQNARHVMGRIKMEVISCRDDKREYDLDNLMKAIQDSLTKAGIYADDRFIDELTIRRGPVKPTPHIIVHLTGEYPGSADLFAEQPAT